MKWNQKNILKALEEKKKLDELTKGKHGIERETLRIDQGGNLSLTPHPKSLGNPLIHPKITTDFSESQLELVTDPHPNIEEAIKELKEIHKEVAKKLDKELMWPFSMPSILPEPKNIPIARYGNSIEGKKKEIYRKGLANRYGKLMQMLCGIHYNLSFSEKLWETLYEIFRGQESIEVFKNEMNLKMVRSFIKYRWFLSYFTASSPIKHKSYNCNKLDKFGHKKAISLRLSRCGYDNSTAININYNSFNEYIKSIEKAVQTPHEDYKKLGLFKGKEPIQLNDHLLQSPNEYYFPIRLKPKPHKKNFLEGLKKNGVEYAEIRMIDVNPFFAEGVDPKALKLCHLFLLFCLLNEDQSIEKKELKKGSDDQQYIAIEGQKKLKERYLKEAKSIFNQINKIVKYFNSDYQEAIKYYENELTNPNQLPWKVILEEFNNDFISYGLSISRKHLNQLINE